MKVLLKHDVPKLGKAGQVKNVADGYARNYLIPHGVAVLATPGAMKQADALARAEQLRQAQLASDASALAEVLKQTTLTFTARAGEGGKLYGSITSQQIADELMEGRVGSGQTQDRTARADPLTGRAQSGRASGE